MIDVNALNIAAWSLLASCAVAVGAAVLIICCAWFLQRKQRAREVARGLCGAEEHLAETARQLTTS
jgi:Tfp pilus assembly protein PilO